MLCDLTDVTVASEDPTQYQLMKPLAIRAILGNVEMQVTPPGGQILNQCKWRHLVVKFEADASDATSR